jgi:hypothetical protein
LLPAYGRFWHEWLRPLARSNTAKALGLTIPSVVLAIADEVME